METGWLDTDKTCWWFSYRTLQNNIKRNSFYPVFLTYTYDIRTGYCIYPKIDLTNIKSTYKTTTINPDAKLYFDSGSGFPRFKLGLISNKRCIKTSKADIIVVSGKLNYYHSANNFVVIEDDSNFIKMIREDEFVAYYNNDIATFANVVSPYCALENPRIIYTGQLMSYEKDSIYLAKYGNGTYTLPYITDNDLDKIINSMCPEPTFEELSSVVDMLNSSDAATSQLGVKMLQGYNIDKYKLSLRLILCTRNDWWTYSRNTVGAKQLISSLGIEPHRIKSDFVYGSYAVPFNSNETYTVEDIAIAKKLCKRFLTEWFQAQYDNYITQGYAWIPDERHIELK